MAWFDTLFGRRRPEPAGPLDHTDFEDTYPGKTGEGGIPGSTTTSPPRPPVRVSPVRNFTRQGDSGGAVEEGTQAFQHAWEKGGVGNQAQSVAGRRGYRDRRYDTHVVAGNTDQDHTPERIVEWATPTAHPQRWTPQAQGGYLPAEGTGHPMDPAGPGFSRPVPSLPRKSLGRRRIYLTGEVQDFGVFARIELLGLPAMSGSGRRRMRPQTWWEEPAPYFSNYYLSSPTTGTPANPGREESPAQAQVAATGVGSRRSAYRQRRRGGSGG